MRPDHHAQVVSLEERVNIIRAEVHHVVLLLRVSHVVVLEPTLFLGFVRVAPKKIKDFLVVLRVVLSKLDFEWSLDLLDTLDILDCRADTSMAAEDSLLLISDNGCKRHLLKGLIDFRENTVWVIDVLAESFSALVTEAEISVDVLVLMVASEKHDLLWVLELESKEQADDFETVLALVDVVTQEQVVVSVNVSGVSR